MSLEKSESVALGTPAPDFALTGVDDRVHELSEYADKPVLLVVFMCNHCPFVRAVEDRLIALQRDYADRGLQLVGINPNDPARYPEDDFESMKLRARHKSYNFPYLVDETQEVAEDFGAVCTPDLFLYGPDRRLAYHGRIDDSWKDEKAVRRQDLREAIEALLAGRAPDPDQVPSMGCSIKWR